jgi:hypothetical protein
MMASSYRSFSKVGLHGFFYTTDAYDNHNHQCSTRASHYLYHGSPTTLALDLTVQVLLQNSTRFLPCLVCSFIYCLSTSDSFLVRSKGITQGAWNSQIGTCRLSLTHFYVGALYLASYREGAFSEGDMLVLNLLAMQAAVLVSSMCIVLA